MCLSFCSEKHKKAKGNGNSYCGVKGGGKLSIEGNPNWLIKWETNTMQYLLSIYYTNHWLKKFASTTKIIITLTIMNPALVYLPFLRDKHFKQVADTQIM